MAQFENMRKVDLKTGEPAIINLRQLYYADAEANRIGAIVTAGGAPVALTGTCSGTAIRADGTTVPLTGTVDGNMAYVDLIQDCYAVEGMIQIYVKQTTGDVTATLVAAVGTVRLTETDAVIDPGEIIPSVSALITAIDDAVASIPADYSDLLDAIAPDYTDLTFPVSAGTYCWQSGTLYTANQDIATSESWTAAHWDAAPAVTEQVAESKSAVGDLSRRIDALHHLVDYGYAVQSSITTTGTPTTTASRRGTRITMNGSMGPSSSALHIRLNGELAYRVSGDNYKSIAGGMMLQDGHTYRLSLRLVAGTVAADNWLPRVYKPGASASMTALATGTLPDGTKYFDFVYAAADCPDGVKLTLFVNRSTNGAVFTNTVLECFLEDTTVDMTAPANIAADKYFMVGDKLFYSTVAIAQNEAIIPGTNCAALSIADALNQIVNT